MMLEDTRLTASGLVTGTPSYFAPELARGEEPTAAADVWALGATLYTAVEGHGLFPGAGERPRAVERDRLAATTAARAGRLPHRTHRRALDPDPASRWSMADLAHVLRRLEDKHAKTHTRISTAAFASGGSAQGTATRETPVAAATTPTEPSEPAHADPPTAPPAPPRDAAPEARSRARSRDHDASVAWPRCSSSRCSSSSWAPASSCSAAVAAAETGRPARREASPAAGRRARRTPVAAAPRRATPWAPSTGAEQFVDDYYAALPEDTRSGWSSLTPGFQDEVGSYGDYRGFWRTISSVEVTDTRSAG